MVCNTWLSLTSAKNIFIETNVLTNLLCPLPKQVWQNVSFYNSSLPRKRKSGIARKMKKEEMRTLCGFLAYKKSRSQVHSLARKAIRVFLHSIKTRPVQRKTLWKLPVHICMLVKCDSIASTKYFYNPYIHNHTLLMSGSTESCDNT